jgi:hypothetical protein
VGGTVCGEVRRYFFAQRSNVGGIGHKNVVALAGQISQQLLQRMHIAGHHGNLRAQRGKLNGRSAANAFAGPAYNCVLACQVKIHG